MRAIRIHQHGGLDVLQYDDLPIPIPGPGQAVVRIDAAGVNFIDIYHRTGLYKVPLPCTLGVEAAGTVESVASDVTLVRPRDRVVVYTGQPGVCAEYAAIPADKLVKLPDGLDVRLAAAVFLQGITAHYLAFSTYPLKPGDTCLVHAAAGGLGLLLCQIAKRRGARVIGTVSSEAKARLAREAGADDVIIYTEQDFEAETKRITGGVGLQVVYDSVGRTTFDKGLNLLVRRGMMVLCGQSSGPVPPFDLQVLNQKGSLYVTRPTLGHYIATRDELLARATDVLGWVVEGWLRVRIDREYPLRDAADAQRDLESRKTTGKLLLIPAHG
ncbi:MAG TPA: quinone oxidoreductase [Gemmatimonadales bacterium]|nr:quinone oxidoreductase [Gemmatimonadales bacterium]